ncbi:MAG: FAD-dependent oxidoreductase [Hyphomicrobiales bacterium]|nr:FAD-dependent oxidoreductase [Hyphomicrobiales bacterium]
MAQCNYVIVGGGQAGCRAALALRDADRNGKIVLIGAESHPPYERPALSKGVLKGSALPQSVIIRQLDQLAEMAIETHLGQAVEQIDVASSEVVLDDSRRLKFDRLLLATGSRARSLSVPGVNLLNIHSLRTLDDCLALSESLQSCQKLVVVGAGFIGLEVAASARERFGCQVTVVEAGSGVLQRAAPDELRSAVQTLHKSNGVHFLFNDGVSRFEGDSKLEHVILASGRVLKADCVVIGIGVIPETRLAERAGLEVDDGIVVDEFGETSQPNIFAAGEVTRHKNLFLGAPTRRESWQVAQNQSTIAAHAMSGLRKAYNEIPWFWTDQFGHNFQLIGETGPTLQRVTRIYDGALKSTTFFLDKQAVAGAQSVNSGKDIRLVREAIRRGMNITPEQLADPTVNLKSHLVRDPVLW